MQSGNYSLNQNERRKNEAQEKKKNYSDVFYAKEKDGPFWDWKKKPFFPFL